MNRILEVCANSFDSARIAQEGGAHRVELCDNMAAGGTTPSYGQIAACKKYLSIPIYPIIRPRGGNFIYTDVEISIMKKDIHICKELGCEGVVFGVLNQDNTINTQICRELIELSYPMDITFHRAFDRTLDLFKALEDLVMLGIKRVLTSGGANTAIKGIQNLQQLTILAAGRISIMPGAGINPNNLKELMQTGASEFHSTSKKQSLTNNSIIVPFLEDYQSENTSLDTVKELIKILNS